MLRQPSPKIRPAEIKGFSVAPLLSLPGPLNISFSQDFAGGERREQISSLTEKWDKDGRVDRKMRGRPNCAHLTRGAESCHFLVQVPPGQVGRSKSTFYDPDSASAGLVSICFFRIQFWEEDIHKWNSLSHSEKGQRLRQMKYSKRDRREGGKTRT